MKLTLTPQEYQQIKVDLEAAVQELEMLSDELSWYCTDLNDRLSTALEILASGITPEQSE